MSGRQKRNKHQKTEQVSKLEEFPEDFDDVFFINLVLEQDKRISILRNIVYKKIKNDIVDRVASYKDIVELEDSFNVVFDLNSEPKFSLFQWASIREELLDCAFDARFEKNEQGVITTMVVPVERKVNLTETLAEKIKRENEESLIDDEE